MFWVVTISVFVLIALAVWAVRWPSATVTPTPKPSPSAKRTRPVADDLAEIVAEQRVEAAKIEAEILHEVEQVMRDAAEFDDDPAADDTSPRVLRSDYVPKDDEARHMVRLADGRPNLSLANAGDRLAIWSPLDGGAIINPKGSGLRSLGLYCTAARGSSHYPSEFRAADLRPGQWVELKRETDNPHDGHAVGLLAPGARRPFAYVQRGRAPAIAKRMDSGDDMAAVSLRGPGPRETEGVTLLLVGSRSDLKAMLT